MRTLGIGQQWTPRLRREDPIRILNRTRPRKRPPPNHAPAPLALRLPQIAAHVPSAHARARAQITALYWAMTTMTTIGYGDIVAWTSGEKTTAVVVMVFAPLAVLRLASAAPIHSSSA